MANGLRRDPRRDALRPRQRDAAGRARRRLRRRRPTATAGRAPTSSIADGRIERIDRAGRPRPACRRLDLDRGMVWPASSTCTPISTRATSGRASPTPTAPSSARSTRSATTATRDWSADDVAARMDFCAPLRLRPRHRRCSAPISIRLPPQHRISWPVFAEMRDALGRPHRAAGACRSSRIDAFLDDGFADELVDTVAAARRRPRRRHLHDPRPRPRCSTACSHRAPTRGLDLDFHVDETGDPAARSLRAHRRRGAPPPTSRARSSSAIAARWRVQPDERGGRHDGPRRRGRHRRRLAADVQHVPAGPRTPAARRAGAASRCSTS